MPKTYAQIGSDFLLWFRNDASILRNLEEIDQRTFETMIESAFWLTNQMELLEFTLPHANYSLEQINDFEIRVGKQVLEWRNTTAFDFLNDTFFRTVNERFETISPPFLIDQNTVEMVLVNLDINVFGTRPPEPVNQENEIQKAVEQIVGLINMTEKPETIKSAIEAFNKMMKSIKRREKFNSMLFFYGNLNEGITDPVLNHLTGITINTLKSNRKRALERKEKTHS